jgi:hypothetical protein
VRSVAPLAVAVSFAIGALTLCGVRSEPALDRRFDGFNVIVATDHPYGSESEKLALANAKELGARAIAIVPFMWQAGSTSPDLIRGKDMTDAELRLGIRNAHALGLAVLIKPHVWVPQSWAGTVAMNSEEAWQVWFANYQRELERFARVAGEEGAEAVVIGTELDGTTQRPEWKTLIDSMRGLYSGRLLYVAHNVEGAEAVPFWERLDFIGVSLYPPLGNDGDRGYRLNVMRDSADRLDVLAMLTKKQIVVGEIGLRSAEDAAAKPWESAEERDAAPDSELQASVLADWLSVLDRPSIKGVLIWRWLTDPNGGGPADTDFTVQGKPAEHALMCAWTQSCERDERGLRAPLSSLLGSPAHR